MGDRDWTRAEVEAIVDDHFAMLERELAGVAYSKKEHRLALARRLDGRSEGSIEFKHQNLSAVLVELGLPHIVGYRWRGNYQSLLREVTLARLEQATRLRALAAQHAESLAVVPEVTDLAALEVEPPAIPAAGAAPRAAAADRPPMGVVNYLEREARNQSLGLAGEELVVAFEQDRLERSGASHLAGRVEHSARVRGDHLGYDILSYETDGRERLIEVKTTRYGEMTPFFITPNEIEVSEREAGRYRLYRLYAFARQPRFFVLHGRVRGHSALAACLYRASPLGVPGPLATAAASAPGT
jgi:hypothetical protein